MDRSRWIRVATSLAMATGLVILGGGCAPDGDPDAGLRPDPAPLVVMVVVDQLRGDLIQRYDSLFTGGLRRVLDESWYFENGSHDHAYTETAAGHTTLATGSYPRNHGITANEWLQDDGAGGLEEMYAVGDSAAPILGSSEPGRSPRNLMRDGLADWIRTAHPEAKIASVSRKDRAAITLASRSAAQVFWLSYERPRFTSSTYYMSALPEWVERFNAETLPGFFGDSTWTEETPEAWRARVRADEQSYERASYAGSAFPHPFQGGGDEAFTDWYVDMPHPDGATVALAVAAIEELELGADAVPDLLAISLSQVDGVGHGWGPLSREQLDNLLRLDRSLGTLFAALDERVGEGRWVMAFSADHGVATAPEAVVALGGSAGRVDSETLELHYDRARAAVEGAQAPERGHIAAATYMEGVEWIAAGYSRERVVWEVENGEVSDSFIPLYHNSMVEGRWAGPLSPWGVELRQTEGWLIDGYPDGTGHGSPYWYDRWVPIAFLGRGVEAAREPGPAATVDVAPTLAALAGIEVAGPVDGRDLSREEGEGP